MSGWMAALGDLHFLRPLWFVALPALVLAAWLGRADPRRERGWRDSVDAHLLPFLLDPQAAAAQGRRWGRWLGLLAAAVAIVALAGPSLRKDQQPLWETRAPLVVALDLSSATLADDLPPNRLAQARAKLATLLRERSGGQVALVAYAGDAFTVAPLTDDMANVALFLDALAPDVMPEDGQRTDRAIAWSQRLLVQAGFAHGDILLLADHADAAAIAAATRARAAGYRVSALGMGTARGGVFETALGVGQARLDAASLQRLAASGGGVYQALGPAQADLRALGVLEPKAGTGTAARGAAAAGWRDEGYWLLPLVLLLALPLFRRTGTLAVLLACTLLVPPPAAQAQAPGTPPAAGSPGPLSGMWLRPDQRAHARMLEGVAAYRQGDYARAIERFRGIDGATAHYNVGNALAKQARYDEAIAAYDQALRLQPGHADAAANRAAVDAARKRTPPPGQGQQPDPRPGRQPGQQGQGAEGEDGRQPSPSANPGGAQSPAQVPPPSASPQAQREADAAQRQRMQDALRQQGDDGATPAPAPRPPETPEQRERRMANQAQLQRIPDDPGGLLRARLRLEHERRQQGLGP